MTSLVPGLASDKLSTLNGNVLLDPQPERAFEQIVRSASTICDTPIAMITMVEGTRQGSNARVGIKGPVTLWEYDFCAHAINTPRRVMVVADAAIDKRFASNPLVTGKPNIRFYAGAPLHTQGEEALGVLSVIDRIPREPDPKLIEALQILSKLVVAQMQLRDSIQNLEQGIWERDRHIQQMETYQRKLETNLTQMEFASLTDDLTGAKNRRALSNQLGIEYYRASRYSTPLSLLILDLDHFKEYNDAFGHPAGDEVLRQAARVIKENSRAHDIVVRYGGDEFVIILPNTLADAAIVIGERYCRSIQQAAWSQKQMTASIGAATLTPSMASSEELFLLADKSLYHAKQNGRSRVSCLQKLKN